MTERLLSYENVRVFCFQNQREIVCDLNNYADYTHYTPEINQYMVKCFESGDCEVKAGEMPGQLKKMREIIDSFDFKTLFSKEY